MSKVICNCIICAQEFDPSNLANVTLSNINMTNFKVCQACFNSSDPIDDYRQVREIVNVYLKSAQAKQLFEEVHDILNTRKY